MAYQWQSVGRAAARGLKLAILAATAAGLAWAVHRTLTQASWLKIVEIRLSEELPPAAARKISLRPGDALFGFSAGRLEAQLLADHPELAVVRVRRQWDRGVRVDAVRRRPLAKILTGRRWMGIDATERLFPLEADAIPADLLEIQAPPGAVRTGLSFLQSLRGTGAPWTEKLYKISLTAEEEAVLRLPNETVVVWGPVTWDEDRLARRARRLEILLRRNPGAQRVQFVTDSRIVVAPRPPETESQP